MHYTFSKDNNNEYHAVFDEAHTFVGYWLKSNYDHTNIKELQRLLNFSEKLQQQTIDDFQISQKGYYLQLSSNGAKLIALSTLENPELDSDAAIDGKMDFDNMTELNIPLPAFNQLLNAWLAFLSR